MRWGVISVCATLIVLIGLPRIYLGEHRVSDVDRELYHRHVLLIILILLYLLVVGGRGLIPDGNRFAKYTFRTPKKVP